MPDRLNFNYKRELKNKGKKGQKAIQKNPRTNELHNWHLGIKFLENSCKDFPYFLWEPGQIVELVDFVICC